MVALGAALLGGTGNVAFTLHQGSQSALSFSRFAAGLVFSVLWLAALRRRPALPPRTGRSRTIILAAGIFNASAISLVISAAPRISVLTLTILGLATPAFVALGARLMGFHRASPKQVVYACVALFAAAAAGYDGSSTGVDSLSGVVVVLLATFTSVFGTLVSVKAARSYHPVAILVVTCAVGTFIAAFSGLAGSGGGLVWGAGTFASGVYIALVPGGVGNVALLWAQAHTAPHIVSSIGSAGIITAGVLGWLLLGQLPSSAALAAAVVIAVAVAGIALNEPKREGSNL